MDFIPIRIARSPLESSDRTRWRWPSRLFSHRVNTLKPCGSTMPSNLVVYAPNVRASSPDEVSLRVNCKGVLR